jgi:hypothetical protein
VAVLIEAICVVVRRDSIDRSFNGGWAGFCSCVPNATLCTDEKLARIGFMDPEGSNASSITSKVVDSCFYQRVNAWI